MEFLSSNIQGIKTLGQKHSARGFTLLLSLLLASVFLTIAVSMATIGLSELQISGLGRDAQSAFYAADAGSECAMYWDMQKNIFSGGNIANIKCNGANVTKVDNNTFKVQQGGYCALVDVNKTAGGTDIQSTGYRGDCSDDPTNVLLSRKVDVSYTVCTDPTANNIGQSGACTYGPPPPGVDVCPNIPGNQATVPSGKIIDASGNCVDGGGGGGGPSNNDPVITSFTIQRLNWVLAGPGISCYGGSGYCRYRALADATDADGDPLTYTWDIDRPAFADPANSPSTPKKFLYQSPTNTPPPGNCKITLTVTDGKGGLDWEQKPCYPY